MVTLAAAQFQEKRDLKQRLRAWRLSRGRGGWAYAWRGRPYQQVSLTLAGKKKLAKVFLEISFIFKSSVQFERGGGGYKHSWFRTNCVSVLVVLPETYELLTKTKHVHLHIHRVLTTLQRATSSKVIPEIAAKKGNQKSEKRICATKQVQRKARLLTK